MGFNSWFLIPWKLFFKALRNLFTRNHVPGESRVFKNMESELGISINAERFGNLRLKSKSDRILKIWNWLASSPKSSEGVKSGPPSLWTSTTPLSFLERFRLFRIIKNTSFKNRLYLLLPATFLGDWIIFPWGWAAKKALFNSCVFKRYINLNFTRKCSKNQTFRPVEFSKYKK